MLVNTLDQVSDIHKSNSCLHSGSALDGRGQCEAPTVILYLSLCAVVANLFFVLK